MKTLFICLTDYQLLNALNIKLHLLKDKQADILFLNNKEGYIELQNRLEKSNIFDKVYLLDRIEIKGLHKFFRNMTDGEKRGNIWSASVNSFEELLYKIDVSFRGPEYKINKKIYGGKRIDFNCYDQVFCFDTKEVVYECVNCVLESTDGNCEINLLDEGVGSYLYDNIKRTRFPVNNVFLYRPDLVSEKHSADTFLFREIPKISKNDEDLKLMLNSLFSYKGNDENWKNRIIFFDQNWDPMPKYLTNLRGIKKVLLQHLHRRHLKESFMYDIKMKLFSKLFSNNDKDIIVKLHPRSESRFMEDYSKYPCLFPENFKAPWELFCLNMSFENNTWVTINSSAVTSYLFTISGIEKDLKIILLYKLAFDEDEILREDVFFQKVKKCFPDIIFIPETISEYEKILSEV